MTGLLKITIQPWTEDVWPVIAEYQQPGTLLSLRSKGRLEIPCEPPHALPGDYRRMAAQCEDFVRIVLACHYGTVLGDLTPVDYGTVLGQALFRGAIRDALFWARGEASAWDSTVRVLVSVEAVELTGLHWEWLCSPLEDGRWELLSLDQRTLFSPGNGGCARVGLERRAASRSGLASSLASTARTPAARPSRQVLFRWS